MWRKCGSVARIASSLIRAGVRQMPGLRRSADGWAAACSTTERRAKDAARSPARCHSGLYCLRSTWPAAKVGLALNRRACTTLLEQHESR